MNFPPGQFRVVGVDCDEGGLYIIGSFERLAPAKAAAWARASLGHPVYIYDEHGAIVLRYGSWA